MSKALTTNKLIESVKRRASIPESQNVFQEDDFLAFANEQMDIGMIPHVISFHEEYFIYSELREILPNVTRYEIPTRAVGNKLREIAYQDNNGNIYEMTQISIDNLASFQNNLTNLTYTAFYVEGNDIVLIPDVGPTPVGFLKFSYYLRPNELVSENRVAIVTAINSITGNITVNAVPTNITTSDSLDLIQTKSPFKTLHLDIVPTVVDSSSNTITFNDLQNFLPADVNTATDIITITNHGLQNNQPITLSTSGSLPTPLTAGTPYYVIYLTPNTFQLAPAANDPAIDLTTQGTGTHILYTANIPSGLSVGDQIALSGETIVPQIPQDLHSMLAQRVANSCLESLGDERGLGMATAKLAEMEQKTGSILQNRVEGAVRKVNNTHSMLKRRRLYWW